MAFKPAYSKWGLVWLLGATGGLTTRELAECTGVPYETARSRCLRLEREGRIQRLNYGRGRTEESVWYAAE